MEYTTDITIEGKTFTIPTKVKYLMDKMFRTHESLMVKLCEILKLDYVEATEEDAIQKVTSLVELLKKSEFAGEGFCWSCGVYYGHGAICDLNHFLQEMK